MYVWERARWGLEADHSGQDKPARHVTEVLSPSVGNGALDREQAL